MSRDSYGPSSLNAGGGGSRSPRSCRRLGELPTVDRSPSRSYPNRGSPVGRKSRPSRSGNNSPEHGYGHHMNSIYYRDEELGSPVMIEERGRSLVSSHHRSRSATRAPSGQTTSVRYQSLDRGNIMDATHDREFMPIREQRDRSLDRGGLRDRGVYLEEDLYVGRSRQSPNHHHSSIRDGNFIGELQYQNSDLQRELSNLKKELELTNQKLGSSMHSIKTFWSPELKKERALRKEESAKYSLINDQLKLLNSENQVSKIKSAH